MTGIFVRMTMNSSALTVLIVMYVWLLSSGSFSYGAKRDIDCLRAIKDSLEDPFNYLNTWDFNNSTEGFICRFTGVDCWESDNVLNIRLSEMGLKGEFPRGIANCTALTGLDMSSNKLYGPIPSNISRILQFVTSLDLSSNKLSGDIPSALANCSYLNVLKLDNNQLSGQIPAQIGLLGRIKTFSVANNRLTGPVPKFINATISADSYAGNAGLCGSPLPTCKGPPKKSNTGIIAMAAVGGVTVSALVVGVVLFFLPKKFSAAAVIDFALSLISTLEVLAIFELNNFRLIGCLWPSDMYSFLCFRF